MDAKQPTIIAVTPTQQAAALALFLLAGRAGQKVTVPATTGGIERMGAKEEKAGKTKVA